MFKADETQKQTLETEVSTMNSLDFNIDEFLDSYADNTMNSSSTVELQKETNKVMTEVIGETATSMFNVSYSTVQGKTFPTLLVQLSTAIDIPQGSKVLKAGTLYSKGVLVIANGGMLGSEAQKHLANDVSPRELKLASNAGMKGVELQVSVQSASESDKLRSFVEQLLVSLKAAMRLYFVNTTPGISSQVSTTRDGVKITFNTLGKGGTQTGKINEGDGIASEAIGSIFADISLVTSSGMHGQDKDITPVITIKEFKVNSGILADTMLSSILWLRSNWIPLLGNVMRNNPALCQLYNIPKNGNIEAILFDKTAVMRDGKRVSPAVALRCIIQPDDTSIYTQGLIATMLTKTPLTQNGVEFFPAGKQGRFSFKNLNPLTLSTLIDGTAKGKNASTIDALSYYNVAYTTKGLAGKIKELSSLLQQDITVTGLARVIHFGPNSIAALTNAASNLVVPTMDGTNQQLAMYTQDTVGTQGW